MRETVQVLPFVRGAAYDNNLIPSQSLLSQHDLVPSQRGLYSKLVTFLIVSRNSGNSIKKVGFSRFQLPVISVANQNPSPQPSLLVHTRSTSPDDDFPQPVGTTTELSLGKLIDFFFEKKEPAHSIGPVSCISRFSETIGLISPLNPRFVSCLLRLLSPVF